MEHQIKSEAALRALMGEPIHPLVVAKSASVITEPLKRYIELSPFVCLGTHAANGACDLSPRGDPPGFVQVLDEKTLIIPERPGNKRLDSVINIINQPNLSLLFLIPGVLETVRVNGTGIITCDPDLLSRFPIKGKLPEIAIVVTVEEAFGHCSKAFRRSKLWASGNVPELAVPTLAEMMSGHLQLDATMSAELEYGIADDAKNRMY